MEQLTNGEEAWIQVQVQLTARLQEALDCEAKFRPHLQLPAAGTIDINNHLKQRTIFDVIV